MKRRDNRSTRQERISAQHASNISDSNLRWPRIVSREEKDECLTNFIAATNTASLTMKVCSICGEEKTSSDLHSSLLELTLKDVELLSRDHSSPITDRLAGHPTYSGLYIDPNGIVGRGRRTVFA